MRGRQRAPQARKRVGVGLGVEAVAVDRCVEHRDVATEVPADAAAVAHLRAGAKAQLGAIALDHGFVCIGRAGRVWALERTAVGAREPGDQVDAVEAIEAAANRRMRALALAALEQHVYAGRARGRRDRQLGVLGTLVAGLQHAPLRAQHPIQRELPLDPGLGVIGDHDHGVVIEELIEAAGGADELGERVVGASYRLELRLGAVLVGVVVVVGQREQQEVVEVMFDELMRDAGRVLVAGARTSQGRLAGNTATRVELTVEELVGAPGRVPEAGGDRDATQQALEAELVAGAPSIDQKRGAGRAQPGVAEALEHGLHLVGEVGHVHVVDRVVERAEEPEGPGCLERAAVLDVAPFGAVIPVHRADPMAVGTGAGDDLRAADRRHRGKRADAVADQPAALEQRRERWRVARIGRRGEHVGAQGIDDAEDELAARCHRRVLRPSYLRDALRRRPNQIQTRPIKAAIATGETTIESPASASAATAIRTEVRESPSVRREADSATSRTTTKANAAANAPSGHPG